ncbi:MAG: hypothetical protein H6822_01245 [Planctomycetaceae bacterium]|nr:hypothetical protein [Planctomycetales bacterium]MCB9920772.1 hypothetical protein [Planctomycetaceae bacterium]
MRTNGTQRDGQHHCAVTRFAARPDALIAMLLMLASCVIADDEFAPLRLERADADSILARAHFLTQDSHDRPQLDANVLRAMNALPQISLRVDNAVFHLSKPFSFYGGRQIALAFIDVDNEVHARVLYRSNSQFCWRMCDATDGGHIGKGFHEFDKQVPISLTVTLLKMHDDPQSLKSFDDNQTRSQADLSKHLLQGLTVDRRSPQCLSRADGHYFSREFAAFIPSEPMKFSSVGKLLPTASSTRVADPREVALPAREQLPNLQREISTFTFTSSAYAQVNNGQGSLTGRVFESHDGTMRYLFFEDVQRCAALSAVEGLLPEINAMGLRSRYVDVRGMDAPLIEYFLQIPAEFGGRRDAGYTSNWKYVRELPIIRYYYEAQNRAVPPARN